MRAALKPHWMWVVTVGWVIVSLLGWLLTLALLQRAGNLDTDASLSAAQVFTGVAGFGAGGVAIFGLYRDLRPKSPRLTLFVYRDEAHVWRAFVTNDGSAPALGCLVQFSGHSVPHEARMRLSFEGRDFWAPVEVAAPFNQGGSPGNWNHIMELAFARPIEQGVEQLKIADVRWEGDHLNVSIRGENMAGLRPTWNSQVDASGVGVR